MSTDSPPSKSSDDEQTTAEFYDERRERIDELADQDDIVGVVARSVKAVAEAGDD